MTQNPFNTFSDLIQSSQSLWKDSLKTSLSYFDPKEQKNTCLDAIIKTNQAHITFTKNLMSCPIPYKPKDVLSVFQNYTNTLNEIILSLMQNQKPCFQTEEKPSIDKQFSETWSFLNDLKNSENLLETLQKIIENSSKTHLSQDQKETLKSLFMFFSQPHLYIPKNYTSCYDGVLDWIEWSQKILKTPTVLQDYTKTIPYNLAPETLKNSIDILKTLEDSQKQDLLKILEASLENLKTLSEKIHFSWTSPLETLISELQNNTTVSTSTEENSNISFKEDSSEPQTEKTQKKKSSKKTESSE